ncbi:sulfotransferase [Pacificoceanicola onchidii]|uniref:sulfotransferase n=1 Tax=Pacificoceanicola onchidii TaxID=2562685 RepID=UPI0010A59F63|nr:sulfotransferase [Pacificoceanicola onchidii]
MKVQTSPLPNPALSGKTFFLCIGAAKCATSWLYHYLAGLEGAVVSPLKEVHFFDTKHPETALGDLEGLARRRLKWRLEQGGDPGADPLFQASVDRVQMGYDDNAYFAHFARLCGPDSKAFCDITPGYSAIGSEGFQRIKDFAATQDVRLRVLFVMRDPVARFWSQLRHLEQVNPGNDISNRWREAITALPLTARADYAGIVTAMDAVFAPEERLCLFYEKLFEEESLRRLCGFAGLEYAEADTATKHNETKGKAEMPEGLAAALRAQLAPQYRFCAERFGADVPPQWARAGHGIP